MGNTCLKNLNPFYWCFNCCLKNNETDNNIDTSIINNINDISTLLPNTNQIPYSFTPQEELNENEENNLKCIRIIKGHLKWCNCLLVLHSGNLCSCSGDKSINIYSNDLLFNVIINLKQCHDDFILFMTEIQITKNNYMLASSSSDGTVKFWKIDLNLHNYYLIQKIVAHESDSWKILYIYENNHLISCGSDSLMKVWKFTFNFNENNKININYNLTQIIKEHKYWISSIIQVKNRKKNINYLVSGSGDTAIKFYDVYNNYKIVHSMDRVICCQQGTLVNYDDRHFLIGGGRGIFFFVVNFVNFQVETKILGNNEEVNSILVLKNNKYIKNGGFIIGGKERSFHYVYEKTYKSRIIKYNAHEKYIYSIVQIGDNLLASSSYDNAIKIWKYNEKTFV